MIIINTGGDLINNIKEFLVLISFFAILVMFTGVVSAANLTVNPGDSIQSVIDNASNNDTIIINDNNGTAYTYTENINVNKTVQLKAKTGGNITVKTLNSSNPVFTVNSGGSGSLIQGFTITGGFTLTGDTQLCSSGIYLNGASDCSIIGNSLNNNKFGISIRYDSNNNIISGNTLTNSLNGIYLYWHSNNNTIQNNIMISNLIGIYLWGNSNNNLISGNTITNSTTCGIYIQGSKNNTIQDNTATNNARGISVYSSSSNNLISGNTVTNSSFVGIGIDNNSNNNTVQNNTVQSGTASDKYGICITNNSTNNQTKNNTVTNNYYGIAVSNSNDNMILDNTVTNNSWMGISCNGSSNCKIQNNNIVNNFYGIYLGYANNAIITENTITGGTYGVNPQYSTATIQFNRIFGCSLFSLVSQCNSTINAANNWWGVSNPSYIYSPDWVSTHYDIYVSSGTVTYNPSFSVDIGFTLDGIKDAATTVKTYIETNHQLPSSVVVSGISVNMPQFLKLATKAVLNIDKDLDTPIVLGNPGTASNPTENITSGAILDDDFISMANTIKSFMDVNGTAPGYVSNTSLGDYMRYESLVYMYSQIMASYNASEGLPDSIVVTPWMAVTNTNGTFNFRTQKIFDSIQAAIDDADTLNDDTIWLRKEIYSENVNVNKKLAIRPISGVNVTVQAVDSSKPVFTINLGGSGSLIQGLNLAGNYCGIFLEFSSNNTIQNNTVHSPYAIMLFNSSNNTIQDNTATGGAYGIDLLSSSHNIIQNNTLTNNQDGIYLGSLEEDNLDGSNDNTIKNNMIASNQFGISIFSSNNNTITENNIINNTYRGIYLYNSSADINFNRITGNWKYGLMVEGNSTINATNNWWGTNNPLVSSSSPSDICIVNGTVTYDPWLVLNINSSCDSSNRAGACYNYIITADLTHNNQGNDTSSDHDNIPDDIPINFVTTLGTINTPVSTRDGKAVATLTSTAIGTANVSITLDNQTVTKTVNVESVNALGVYNTRTNMWFGTIQAAINDSNTLNGDTLTLRDGTYTENVVVNKQLTIKPVDGANVIVQPAESDDSDSEDSEDVDDSTGDVSVFTINSAGSGSTIQGLNIKGNDNSDGINLDAANNCNISGNTITGNDCGIYLNLSNNNTILGNIIRDNYYGIGLDDSNSTIISGNNLTSNYYGIYLGNSTLTNISGNNLADNWDGIHLYESNNNTITENTVKDGWIGVYLYTSNNIAITGNTLTGNGGGITYYDSNNTNISGNTLTGNWVADISQVNSNEIIMATTIYTCGPAALATVMKNIGVNATEEELASLAGTDETGTTMYGLAKAARAKGLNAVGAKLTIDQLRTNYIVVLSINESYHYNLIRNITDTTVYLTDPNLGNIEMNMTKFSELYSGYVLVVANGTIQLNGTLLTDEEMQNIKAMRYNARYKWVWVPGYWYKTKKWVSTGHYRWKSYWVWIHGYWKRWGGHSYYIKGHYVKRYKKVWVRSGYWRTAWRYKKGHWMKVSRYAIVHATCYIAHNSTTNGTKGYVANHRYYSDWRDAPSAQHRLGKRQNWKYAASHLAVVIGVPTTVLSYWFPPAGIVGGICSWVYSFTSDGWDKPWI